MLDWGFWLTLAVVLGMTVSLAFELARAELIVLSALLILLLAGVVTPSEAFAGFSNHGMLAVAFLYVSAAALEATGLLQSLSSTILGRTRGTMQGKIARLVFPVAGASAFLNNTPLVAMFIPLVKSWCRRHNVPASRFLIPLSYAAMLGGTMTLIGTSTNLVVHGLLLQRGLPGFSFFELSRVGLPITIVGLGALTLVLHRLLPSRKGPVVELGEGTREFVIQVKVGRKFYGVGRTVEGAGLRHLQGLFLFQIVRNGDVLSPIEPQEIVHEGDRLFFTGLPSTIVELQRQPGLLVVKEAPFDLKNYDSSELKTYEAVVSANSPLVGSNVRQSNFRSRYDGVILAIHRSGERINSKIGDVVLAVGDTLLILAPKSFYTRWYHSRDFYLISASDEVPSKPRQQAFLTLVVILGMVGVVTGELLPMVVAAAIAAIVLVLSRSITLNEAYASVDWGTLLVIASSLGLAAALENSGVATWFAHRMVSLAGDGGMLTLIALVYFSTVLYTEFITNNAAAALVLPVALAVAQQTALPTMAAAYAVTIGASCGFAIPFGYQTNLMVFGPGGYRFRDFLKIGLPMDIIVGVTAVLSIYAIFGIR